MFDLRYHVASLAAVFLALIIGILVGVGISGPVDNQKTKFLEEQVAKYQRQLDQTSTQSKANTREQKAALAYIDETYPVLVKNRLRGKKVAVVFVGDVKGGIPSEINRLFLDSGAQQLRLRALKVPIDVRQLNSALKGQPAAVGLRGRQNVEALGRALGQELMLGGDTAALGLAQRRARRRSRRRQQGAGRRRRRRTHHRPPTRCHESLPTRPLLGPRVGCPGDRRRADGRGALGHEGLRAGGPLIGRQRRYAGGAFGDGPLARGSRRRAIRREEVRRGRRPPAVADAHRRGWLSRSRS